MKNSSPTLIRADTQEQRSGIAAAPLAAMPQVQVGDYDLVHLSTNVC